MHFNGFLGIDPSVGYCEDIKGIDLYKDKNWYQVCGTHDKQLGRTNLISGGWSKKDAIAVERNPEIEPSIPSYI